MLCSRQWPALRDKRADRFLRPAGGCGTSPDAEARYLLVGFRIDDLVNFLRDPADPGIDLGDGVVNRLDAELELFHLVG